MPKRTRSRSAVPRATIKRRRYVNARRRGKSRFRRFIRRTLFSGLERHQTIYRGNDAISSGGGYHWMVRAFGQGEARTSYTSTEKTRDGYRIQPLSICMYGTLTIADSTNIFRLIVLRAKNTFSGVSDVLQTYGAGSYAAGVYDVYSPYKRENMGSKYKVFYDKTFMLNDDIPQRMFSYKVPRKALKQIKYTGDSMDDWCSNMWVLILISDSTAPSHPSCDFVISSIFCNI